MTIYRKQCIDLIDMYLQKKKSVLGTPILSSIWEAQRIFVISVGHLELWLLCSASQLGFPQQGLLPVRQIMKSCLCPTSYPTLHLYTSCLPNHTGTQGIQSGYMAQQGTGWLKRSSLIGTSSSTWDLQLHEGLEGKRVRYPVTKGQYGDPPKAY